MLSERRDIINEIKNAINKRKENLLKKIPLVHTINDGIIIRFFHGWKESEHSNIKYIEIKEYSNSNEKTYYFFLPKGSIFDIRKHIHDEVLICLDGKIQLHYGGTSKIMKSFSRFNIPSETEHYGIAIENTYILVISKIKNNSPIV